MHRDKEKSTNRMSWLMFLRKLFQIQIRNSFSEIKLVHCCLNCAIKQNPFALSCGTLLMISHLLVLLNFFSHFLLYGHSCQWSVGTVKHVQSPSAFTTSPVGSKMPVLISKNPWAHKMVHLQSIPCKHPTLTQQFLLLLQAARAKTNRHKKKQKTKTD